MLQIHLLGVLPTALFELLLGLNLAVAIALTVFFIISYYANPKKYPLYAVILTLIVLWWQLMVIGPCIALIVLLVLKFRKAKTSVVAGN